MRGRGFTAELVESEGEPEIGRELIRVHYDDGRIEELYLHDYERLYALPGVYEKVVHERLGCRSPAEIASMLAAAMDSLGWPRAEVRVLDIAAGNGVSGEALAAQRLRPVLGTDIVPTARAAALRDRPGVYGGYLTLDLLALSAQQRRAIRSLAANALSCVAPVGDFAGQLPAGALAAAVALLEPDAVVAYLHDPTHGVPDAITPELWAEQLGPGGHAELLSRRRYVHRRTQAGEPFELDGAVWRLCRQPGAPAP